MAFIVNKPEEEKELPTTPSMEKKISEIDGKKEKVHAQVVLRTETKNALDEIKLHPREPYNDVIVRLIREHTKEARPISDLKVIPMNDGLREGTRDIDIKRHVG